MPDRGRTLRPLLGVRAIAEAAGLDPREVAELAKAGNLRALNGRLVGRQIACARDEQQRVNWADLIDEIT